MSVGSMWARPFVVECGHLRSKLVEEGLRVVDRSSLAAVLGVSEVVVKRSSTGVFSYSEDDANVASRDVGAHRFAVSFDRMAADEFVSACAAQSRTSEGGYHYYTAPLVGA